MPRLRFPEFREAPGWLESSLAEIISTVTPPKKLQTSSYLSQGSIPVVDQSAAAICGWTDDMEAVIGTPLPLIVFGDHTCVVKLVRQPFAQGADGIKIFYAQRGIETEFLFHSLANRPLVMEDYKRHFSILKERKVLYPNSPPAEQRQIAECLTSLDELIAAEWRKLEALCAYKKGLMQNLFPREGETAPRLRFPEFRSAGDWSERWVRDLLQRLVQPVEVDQALQYRQIGIRSHGKGIFHKEPVSGEELGDKRVFWVQPDALVVNIVFAWEQAVATTSAAEEGMIASHRFPMYAARNGRADVRFMKHFLLTAKGKELLGIASPGGAGRNKTLGQREFESLKVTAPVSHAEQSQIADSLDSLDSLITAQSKKLDTLKAQKQGLMQGLFPVSQP